MPNQNFNRIQKNSGVYTCVSCGKQTRETGADESSVEMCKKCYIFAGQENTHSDCHSGNVKECAKCREDLAFFDYDLDDIDEWCDNDGEPESPYNKQ
jgi:hypothetical protein